MSCLKNHSGCVMVIGRCVIRSMKHHTSNKFNRFCTFIEIFCIFSPLWLTPKMVDRRNEQNGFKLTDRLCTFYIISLSDIQRQPDLDVEWMVKMSLIIHQWILNQHLIWHCVKAGKLTATLVYPSMSDYRGTDCGDKRERIYCGIYNERGMRVTHRQRTVLECAHQLMHPHYLHVAQ